MTYPSSSTIRAVQNHASDRMHSKRHIGIHTGDIDLLDGRLDYNIFDRVVRDSYSSTRQPNEFQVPRDLALYLFLRREWYAVLSESFLSSFEFLSSQVVALDVSWVQHLRMDIVLILV
jgi:hypothetical protein